MYDYVGFTEEESQAWLRNFRLLQHKMVSLVLAKYLYTLIFSLLRHCFIPLSVSLLGVFHWRRFLV